MFLIFVVLFLLFGCFVFVCLFVSLLFFVGGEGALEFAFFWGPRELKIPKTRLGPLAVESK